MFIQYQVWRLFGREFSWISGSFYTWLCGFMWFSISIGSQSLFPFFSAENTYVINKSQSPWPVIHNLSPQICWWKFHVSIISIHPLWSEKIHTKFLEWRNISRFFLCVGFVNLPRIALNIRENPPLNGSWDGHGRRVWGALSVDCGVSTELGSPDPLAGFVKRVGMRIGIRWGCGDMAYNIAIKGHGGKKEETQSFDVWKDFVC